MTAVLVVYASRHGGTQGIAERIGQVLRTDGIQAEVQPADQVAGVGNADAVVIGSGVYMGSWLHEATDFLRRNVDGLAERAVQLGGVAEGTARAVAKRSSLAEYPAKAVDGRGHVEALSSALAAFGTAARKAIDRANELGDLDTADLFTEVSRGIDKWLWFVEAHTQATK